MLAETALEPLSDDRLVDENGRPTDIFVAWMEIVTQNSNNSVPLTGSGAPETIVTAEQGRWYVDVSGIPAAIYYKQFGDGNTGWIITS